MQAVEVVARFQRRHRERPLVELTTRYLYALAASNKKPDTIAFNAYRLRRLGRELERPLGHHTRPAAITPGIVRASLLSVKSTGVSDRYVEQHRKCWAAFFRWCVDEGELPASPMAHVAAWTVEGHEVSTLGRPELRKLYDATAGTSFLAERDRAIVALLFDTGIRPGELVGLDVEHIRADEATVHGKTRHDRRVPISPRCAVDLHTYIDHWRPGELLASAWRPLFVDRTLARRRLGERGVSQMLDARAREARIQHVTPYTARHTFATLFLLGGGDPLGLRRILGHKDLRMIDQHYAHLVTDDLKRAHALTSPIARLGEG